VRELTRRDFLRYAGGAAAAWQLAEVPEALALPDLAASIASSRSLTTLHRRIVRGELVGTGTKGAYHRLKHGEGEPFMVREDLAKKTRAPLARAFSFVHFTDIHIVDAQSPARVEFTDRYADQGCDQDFFTAAYRPQEALTLHVLEAMIRRIRRIGRGPATGRPFRFVVCTGDNTDNEQYNEARWFIDAMDGGHRVAANSGGGDYEGVQAAGWGDPEYWHPDHVEDKYKSGYGFPEYPGLLADAVRPIRTRGAGMRWRQTFGNHDGLVQGNAPRNDSFNSIATGNLKFSGPPPGYQPCGNPFENLPAAPTRVVAADSRRRILTRHQYIGEHFETTGTPVGHGFTHHNRRTGLAYYSWESKFHRIRFISLDTVNPGGYNDGSVGQTQLDWLEGKLVGAHSRYFGSDGGEVRTKNADRLVVLFSHHGLRSLNNPDQSANPDSPGENDLPRYDAAKVEALVHRFPNVIAWVNGHSHVNTVVPRPDPARRTPGFWDIGTAAHVDWSCQSRILEIAVRRDGTASIFCTMVDHDGPPDPRGATGVNRLASINRELAANDFQKGFSSSGPGEPPDRNVELVLPARDWLRR
jgi:metallophosphoesterase (TIGR03767 family)